MGSLTMPRSGAILNWMSNSSFSASFERRLTKSEWEKEQSREERRKEKVKDREVFDDERAENARYLQLNWPHGTVLKIDERSLIVSRHFTIEHILNTIIHSPKVEFQFLTDTGVHTVTFTKEQLENMGY